MERQIGFEVRALMNLLARKAASCEKSNQCNTDLHGMVIDFLMNNKETEIYQKDIELEFSMRRSTASRMLKLMEQNGMVKRLHVCGDLRLKKVQLTEQAILSHEGISLYRQNIEQELRNEVSEEELGIFFKVIDKLKENIS